MRDNNIKKPVYTQKQVLHISDDDGKAAQFGLPTIMLYAASQGLGQAEFDSMNFLENDVLNLKNVLIPLKSSTQSSSSSVSSDNGSPN